MVYYLLYTLYFILLYHYITILYYTILYYTVVFVANQNNQVTIQLNV